MGQQARNDKLIGIEKNGATLDGKVIIDLFKYTKEEGRGDFVNPMGGDELENSLADDIQESRRWNNPFEGLPSYPNEFELGLLKTIDLVLCYLLIVILTGKFKPLSRLVIQLKYDWLTFP